MHARVTVKIKQIDCNRTELRLKTSLDSTSSAVDARSLPFSPTFYRGSACYPFLWIRIALLHKSLAKIVEFIVNCQSSLSQPFYAPHALCADPVDGAILCSLLGKYSLACCVHWRLSNGLIR